MVDQELSDSLFKKFSDLIYETAGIHLHEGKKPLLQARLSKRLRATGLKSFEEYYRYVTSSQNFAEFINFIDAISTNLTYFFREEQHFTFLEETVLPEIVGKKEKKGEKRLRMWSAACSTGEEPYSMAMCVLEYLEKKHSRYSWDFKILATDISTRVLRVAIDGVYSEERVQKVPPVLRHKYFEKIRQNEEYTYRVIQRLRDIIAFRRLNLKDPYPFSGPFDVIFCRNVMIYFDKPTQQGLITKMSSYLDSGGYFFVGHSESLAGLKHDLIYVRPAVYRKR
ncbi:MAG: protein-glutamate O-methyltransferase [Syntrophobacterales bacterium]|nr:protein-glutamate O-methyltransferase [Syntrophobacterales bacterium]